MNASQAKTGCKYISRTGIPVTVVGTRNGKVSLKMATTGNVIRVNGDYELKLAEENNSVQEGKTHSQIAIKAKLGAQKPMSLASIIDPMLLAGGYTVKEIAAELGKRTGEAAQGKDLEANVRARIVSYMRNGWRVVKDQKTVQIEAISIVR